ncbi:EAL domain-containing protein [Phreatobacter aquaticus]|nr:EAL domain-containing protein [Phreatobacter aquaticus]
MTAIAASVAALCFLAGGVELGYALAIGFALLLAMVIGHLGALQSGSRQMIEARLADLSRSTGEFGRDMAELSSRLDRFETSMLDRTLAATEPMAEEIGELGALVKQFAETLQVHEAAIVRATAAPAMAPQSQPAAQQPAPQPAYQPVAEPAPRMAPPAPPVPVMQRYGEALRQRLDPVPPAPRRASAPDPTLPDIFAGMTRDDALSIVDEAIAAKRYDLFLQPIVTLPQRKVRWYQASVRLRSADGAVLQPADYRELAEGTGLMPALDAETLARCIQVVRRLTSRNRDVGLVCDLSGASLADAAFSNEMVESLDAARSVAGSLVLSFRHDALRAMSPLDIETLKSLMDYGFRFSLHGVGDLRIEPRDLAEKGFRQVKVPAELMLSRGQDVSLAIHPADLPSLFARYGIELIVDDIESEQMVVDLLDYDVKFGQGVLFSPPRPVRAEVLAGAEPAGIPPTQASAQPTLSRAPRTEPRPDPRPAPQGPQSIGAAALAAGAVPQARDQRRPAGIGQGLRALIRDRS